MAARVVEPALEDDDVGVDGAARLPLGERAQACPARRRTLVLRAGDAAILAHERLREPERGQLLADPLGPVEEVRVVHAIVRERAAERGDRCLLREDGRER